MLFMPMPSAHPSSRSIVLASNVSACHISSWLMAVLGRKLAADQPALVLVPGGGLRRGPDRFGGVADRRGPDERQEDEGSFDLHRVILSQPVIGTRASPPRRHAARPPGLTTGAIGCHG